MTWVDEIREVAGELKLRPERWCQFLAGSLADAADQMDVDENGVDHCGECGQEIIACPCEHMKIVIGVVSDYHYDHQGGLWVAFHFDGSLFVPFDSELEALRYALANGAMVRFARFGDEDWMRRKGPLLRGNGNPDAPSPLVRRSR